MDHVKIEDDNLIERYLLGQLSTEDAARFEEHYLECPQCLEKLELSRRLRDGLKEVAAEEGKQLAQTTLLVWLLRRGPWFQSGLLVALLALMIWPWGVLAPRVSRLSSESEHLAGELATALSPQVRTPVYSLSPERSGPGEEPSTRITLRPSPEWVVLELQLPPVETLSPDSVTYQVRLLGADVEMLWQSGSLEPDASGRVAFSVHSSWLEAADYIIELDALAAGGVSTASTRFAFRVQREE